jgi:hypothetical protein
LPPQDLTAYIYAALREKYAKNFGGKPFVTIRRPSVGVDCSAKLPPRRHYVCKTNS